jgi:ABC-type multidrug transport system fused ATPase/permease subunit
MDMILEHWLSAGAGVFLIGMVLYGHYRGALKQCVSLGALILTIVLVKIATPYMTDFIKDNPSIRQSAAEAILDAAGWEEPSAENTELPAAQRIAIENLNLPQSVKETLLENNNSEFYHMLGVDQFAEYVSTYLADILINAVSSIILFAVVYILIHLVVRWLDLIARAVLGLIQGLLFLWIGCFLVGIFSATPLGMTLEEQINASTWLRFLYQYNLINIVLGGIIRGIL